VKAGFDIIKELKKTGLSEEISVADSMIILAELLKDLSEPLGHVEFEDNLFRATSGKDCSKYLAEFVGGKVEMNTDLIEIFDDDSSVDETAGKLMKKRKIPEGMCQ
jgi:hypothetical protein